MIRYTVYTETPHSRIINKAVEALNNGEIIIYPTDTVYGIGCSIYQKSAIENLYKVKGKSKFDPMSMICGSIQQAAEFARVSTTTFRLLRRCFPGPFTFVLEAKNGIAKLMLSRQKEIGIRIPDSPLCQMLVESLGHPLLNTSVMLPEDEDTLQPDRRVYDLFEEENGYTQYASLLLDAGPLPEGEESTVVRVGDQVLEILREGKGDLELLYL